MKLSNPRRCDLVV